MQSEAAHPAVDKIVMRHSRATSVDLQELFKKCNNIDNEHFNTATSIKPFSQNWLLFVILNWKLNIFLSLFISGLQFEYFWWITYFNYWPRIVKNKPENVGHRLLLFTASHVDENKNCICKYVREKKCMAILYLVLTKGHMQTNYLISPSNTVNMVRTNYFDTEFVSFSRQILRM